MEKITRNIFSISTSVLLTLCILQCMNTISLVESMDRKLFLNMHSDLTEFFRLLDTSQYFNATLKFKKGTLFAPTNDAINDFNSRNPGKLDNTTLGYHFCNIEVNTNNLDDVVTSDLQGNPPIFVTKVTTRQGTNIFLNDAQIIKGNLELTLEQIQTVHIIDRVLEPTAPTSPTSSTELMNPDAKKFLEHSASYSISKDYGVKEFATRVAKLGKSEEFRELRRNTFFIPVDDAFKPTATNIASVDSTVIHGHMIVGKTIFLRSAEIDHQFPTYQTSAGASNFPVFVSFSKTTSENTDGGTAETYDECKNIFIEQVFQGEKTMVKDNNLLGESTDISIPPAPRVVPQIEATFDIKANGILNITDIEKFTGNEKTITIREVNDRLSEEENESMVDVAEEYKVDDEKEKGRVSAKATLKSYCFIMKTIVEIEIGKVELDHNIVMDECDDIIRWLDANQLAETEVFKNKQKELQKVCNPIISRIYAGRVFRPHSRRSAYPSHIMEVD